MYDRGNGTFDQDNIFGMQQAYYAVGTATAVPGPLPILGAAAAFGFSRKLRKRIQLNNSAA